MRKVLWIDCSKDAHLGCEPSSAVECLTGAHGVWFQPPGLSWKVWVLRGEITLYESQTGMQRSSWRAKSDSTLCVIQPMSRVTKNTPRVSVGIVLNKDTHVNPNNKNDCVLGTQYPYAHIPEN